MGKIILFIKKYIMSILSLIFYYFSFIGFIQFLYFEDFDNNYAGALATIIMFKVIIVVILFTFIGFIIAFIKCKNDRKVYRYFILILLLPILIIALKEMIK